MPTPTKGARLGGSPSHERIILANLASQLFEHGRIVTTEAKAKRLRPLAEKLITKAKRGDIHARRQVLTTVRDKGVVHVLFTEIAPTFTERDGGYTRITKVGPRKGDNAPMAMIELVTETVEDSRKSKSAATKAPAKKAPAKKAAAAQTSSEQAGSEQSGSEQASPESETPAEELVEGTDERLDETADQEQPSDDTSAEEAAADSSSDSGAEPTGEIAPEQTIEEENVPDQDSSTTKQ